MIVEYPALGAFVNWLKLQDERIVTELKGLKTLESSSFNLNPISLNWSRMVQWWVGSRLVVTPAKWVYLAESVVAAVSVVCFGVPSVFDDESPSWNGVGALAIALTAAVFPWAIRGIGHLVTPSLRYHVEPLIEGGQKHKKEHQLLLNVIEMCDVNPDTARQIYSEYTALRFPAK
jgi:hypothetical protein